MRLAIFVFAVFFATLQITPGITQTATADDTAKYLAGLRPAEGSPLAPLAKERAWNSHSRTLNAAWDRIDKNQLSRIRTWSSSHISEHRETMLYMFSGPDFLYADAFFPKATTYVLSALEPVGKVPDLTKLSESKRAAGLQELRSSMHTVLSYSFFVTKDMKTKLRTGIMKGTLPLLYVFLARAGKTVETVELVSLRSNGKLANPGGQPQKGSSPGVKIVFSGPDGIQRTLYYFRTDLSNGGIAASGFKKFCRELGAANSLVKSASYLLHSGNFTSARDLILQQSDVLVQDDSGIPVRYFRRSDWDLFPFGKYIGPINIFPGRYQSEMKALFAKGRARKVDFGIGYRWRSHETNVLLAIKKPAPAAPEKPIKAGQ